METRLGHKRKAYLLSHGVPLPDEYCPRPPVIRSVAFLAAQVRRRERERAEAEVRDRERRDRLVPWTTTAAMVRFLWFQIFSFVDTFEAVRRVPLVCKQWFVWSTCNPQRSLSADGVSTTLWSQRWAYRRHYMDKSEKALLIIRHDRYGAVFGEAWMYRTHLDLSDLNRQVWQTSDLWGMLRRITHIQQCCKRGSHGCSRHVSLQLPDYSLSETWQALDLSPLLSLTVHSYWNREFDWKRWLTGEKSPKALRRLSLSVSSLKTMFDVQRPVQSQIVTGSLPSVRHLALIGEMTTQEMKWLDQLKVFLPALDSFTVECCDYICDFYPRETWNDTTLPRLMMDAVRLFGCSRFELLVYASNLNLDLKWGRAQLPLLHPSVKHWHLHLCDLSNRGSWEIQRSFSSFNDTEYQKKKRTELVDWINANLQALPDLQWSTYDVIPVDVLQTFLRQPVRPPSDVTQQTCDCPQVGLSSSKPTRWCCVWDG